MFKNRGTIRSLNELKLRKKAERIRDNYHNSSEFNLYIDDSQIKGSGLGVFTEDDILEDTIIGEYRGELIESFEQIDNDYYYQLIEPNKETGQKGLGVDASKLPRCYMAMINDATLDKKYENNCMFEDDIENKKVYVITTRDIKAGEELFVSYGDSYWNS
jgi:SET domain-containing protein